ncbi:hypothetical protein KUL106_13950 [Alteromonas sp. KUL106]|nr:hypothetical protein KUL106_13950 [Alteromonas sp. KUL106]
MYVSDELSQGCYLVTSFNLNTVTRSVNELQKPQKWMVLEAKLFYTLDDNYIKGSNARRRVTFWR